MVIACLHASQSNIKGFEEAAAELGIPPGSLTHTARPDLLAEAEEAGKVTPSLARRTADALLEIGRDADGVLLTCSTLGPAADLAASDSSRPVLRADAALAAEAAAVSGRVTVLCAVSATLPVTEQLFRSAGADATAVLVPGAWELFKAGRTDDYARLVAAAADRAYEEGADLVVLGQASMAPAAHLVSHGPTPPATPLAGLRAVLAAMQESPPVPRQGG